MKILFASSSDDPADWVPTLMAELPEAEIRVHPDVGDPAGIDYALVWKPPPGLLAALPNLKAILSLGAGVDALLADPTLPGGVPLARLVDPGLTVGMTDYVCWQVLAAHRRAADYRAQQARVRWRPLAEALAPERRVGVMGLGELGADAARMLAALRFDVAGWSRSAKSIPGVACFSGAEGLAEFLARTEILVCLLPLTPQTAGVLDADLFARLPRGAHVINAGRGGHLVDTDLLAALDSGQVSTAALDVFHDEPLPAVHPFWRHPRVTVTPHVASVTHARSAARTIAADIRRLEAGQPPAHPVDRRRGY